MKHTAFYDIHKELGAKIVAFAGYEMPIQYPAGIIHEHKVVRGKVGVFDVSHMGEFQVKGPDTLKFVQKITVNDAGKLSPGKAQYSAMTYEDGGIVDDLLVYNISGDEFMLVVNGANIAKDWDWCVKNAEGMDVELNNITDEINLLAVQGPKAVATLQKITDENLAEIPAFNFVNGKIGGVESIISRTGYTGEEGFELYFRGNEADARKVWDAIFEAGDEFGIEPVGLGARDTLRLEKGFCLYGNDIDQTTNTYEACLGWITKLAKGDFNGSDALAKVKEEKPSRKLVAFVSEAEKFIPRKDYPIYIGDKEIGKVTSGNLSPSLGKPVGMGYVAMEYKDPGTKIEIQARGKRFPAEIRKMPLV
ncbi:MAG: glycine cleavage system aminomethyltransferase GcvT [Bacteroidota bacterium]